MMFRRRRAVTVERLDRAIDYLAGRLVQDGRRRGWTFATAVSLHQRFVYLILLNNQATPAPQGVLRRRGG